jgi:dTDP-4-amino-4,6-dideoxygalactose transaminase
MLFTALAPTGSKVIFNSCEKSLNSFFPGYVLTPCASGTAALAVAIKQARVERNIKQPEVILPAYGCPDLVAACVAAEVKPILVDLEASRPWMNLNFLANAINSNTIAIVAVTFLGIRERLADLHALIDKRDIALIEDSAQ